MHRRTVLGATLSAMVSPLLAQPSLQESHILENVPPSEQFHPYLQRDLLAYAQGAFQGAARVEYKLLREGPTQSGVSYPKYYLWAKVVSAQNRILQEGAVRVLAIDRVRFEVTDFLSIQQLRAAPEVAGATFPAGLVPSILSLAGAQ